MFLQFSTASLPDVYTMKLLMPEHKIKLITLTFHDDSEIVDVLLEITSISAKEIDRYFNGLMKETFSIQTTLPIPDVTTPPTIETLPNIYKFNAECFTDVKKWTYLLMAVGLIKSVTISTQAGATDLEVIAHMDDTVTMGDMWVLLQCIEEGNLMWESLERFQQYNVDAKGIHEFPYRLHSSN